MVIKEAIRTTLFWFNHTDEKVRSLAAGFISRVIIYLSEAPDSLSDCRNILLDFIKSDLAVLEAIFPIGLLFRRCEGHINFGRDLSYASYKFIISGFSSNSQQIIRNSLTALECIFYAIHKILKSDEELQKIGAILFNLIEQRNLKPNAFQCLTSLAKAHPRRVTTILDSSSVYLIDAEDSQDSLKSYCDLWKFICECEETRWFALDIFIDLVIVLFEVASSSQSEVCGDDEEFAPSSVAVETLGSLINIVRDDDNCRIFIISIIQENWQNPNRGKREASISLLALLLEIMDDSIDVSEILMRGFQDACPRVRQNALYCLCPFSERYGLNENLIAAALSLESDGLVFRDLIRVLGRLFSVAGFPNLDLWIEKMIKFISENLDFDLVVDAFHAVEMGVPKCRNPLQLLALCFERIQNIVIEHQYSIMTQIMEQLIERIGEGCGDVAAQYIEWILARGGNPFFHHLIYPLVSFGVVLKDAFAPYLDATIAHLLQLLSSPEFCSSAAKLVEMLLLGNQIDAYLDKIMSILIQVIGFSLPVSAKMSALALISSIMQKRAECVTFQVQCNTAKALARFVADGLDLRDPSLTSVLATVFPLLPVERQDRETNRVLQYLQKLRITNC
jgi:hypothetical protein